MSHAPGDQVRLEVLRGSERLKVTVIPKAPPHEVDELASLADPEKSLVRPLGILGIAIDGTIAKALPGLCSPQGVLVVARSAEFAGEVPLISGDVIRTVNGVAVTTLDGLRKALQSIPPGAPIALQIQREDRLLFVSFILDQPLIGSLAFKRFFDTDLPERSTQLTFLTNGPPTLLIASSVPFPR